MLLKTLWQGTPIALGKKERSILRISQIKAGCKKSLM